MNTPKKSGRKRLPRCDTLPRNWKKSQKGDDKEKEGAQKGGAATSRAARAARRARGKAKAKARTMKPACTPRMRGLGHAASSASLLACTVSPTNLAGNSPAACALRSAFDRNACRDQKRLKRAAGIPGGSDTNIRVFVRVRPDGVKANSETASDEDICDERGSNSSSSDPSSFETGDKPFEVTSNTTLVHRISGKHGKTFTFDGIFDSEDCSQAKVFETVGQRQVDKALCGFNGSLFAYGQTGSGKTYTMLGPAGTHHCENYDHDGELTGLIPRVLAYLFEKKRLAEAGIHEEPPTPATAGSPDACTPSHSPSPPPVSASASSSSSSSSSSTVTATAKKHTKTRKISDIQVRVSYLEIYRERIADLLNVQDVSKAAKAFSASASADSKRAPSLRLKEDKKTGPFVEGLKQLVVNSPEEALELMAKGNASRTMASTKMNNTSSRSHAVFTVCISGKIEEEVVHMPNATTNTPTGVLTAKKGTGKSRRSKGRRFTSRINLVDLAGSERQSGTKSSGVRQKEGSAINKSLSVLGTVIMNLVDIGDGKARHIHYRDSKLTFLLRDSLGGNTYTTIIATVTSLPKHAQETLSTLHFAQRAKSVRNRVTRNVITDDATRVQELQKQVRRLKRQMQKAAAEGTSSGSSSTMRLENVGKQPLATQKALRAAKEARAQLKAELNEQIAKEVELQRAHRLVEEKMARMEAERNKAVLDAAAREQELEELRLEHATLASKRRRSSVAFRRRQSRLSTIGAPLSPILPEGLMDRIQEQVQTAKKKREHQEAGSPNGFESPTSGNAASLPTPRPMESVAQQTEHPGTAEAGIMAIAGSQAAAIQTDRVNFAREISCSEASVQHVPMVSNVEVQTEEEALNVKDELRSELESLRAYQKETQANMTKLAASAAKAQEEAGDMCAALRERCKHLEDEKEALRVAKKISLAGPTPAPAHAAPPQSLREIVGPSLLGAPAFSFSSSKETEVSTGLMKVMEKKMQKLEHELKHTRAEKEALKAENRRLRVSAKRNSGSLGARSSTSSTLSSLSASSSSSRATSSNSVSDSRDENRNYNRASIQQEKQKQQNSGKGSRSSPGPTNSTRKSRVKHSGTPVSGMGGVSGPPGPRREDSFSSSKAKGANSGAPSSRGRRSLKEFFYN